MNYKLFFFISNLIFLLPQTTLANSIENKLNYETFQLEDGEFIVSELLKKNSIDYIILDEVQNVKQRSEKDESSRRNVINKLIIHSYTVELLLVEYRHTDGFNWGVDIQNAQKNRIGGTSFNPSFSAGNISLLYDVTTTLSESFTFNLQAMVENGSAKIAQNPRVAADDGEQAKFQITDKIYVQLQASSVNGLTTSLETISTGIDLTVTPTSVDDSLISLSVNGSLSEFIPYESNGYRVETNVIDTKVTIPINETLIIGGMIKEEKLKTKKGLPILSKIPLIGGLFSRIQNTVNYIESVIYITVYEQNTSNNKENKLFHEGSFKSFMDKDELVKGKSK